MRLTREEKLKLLSLMLDRFDPASSLWRTIEISHVIDVLSSKNISGLTLDLGCGEGNIAEIVFDKNKVEVVGLDNWKELLLQARLTKAYKYLVLGDARLLPFKKTGFKNVFSNSVIEHIEEIDSVLSEVSGALEPKGLFIFTVPSDKFGEFLFFYRFFRGMGFKNLADWYRNKRIGLLSHFNLLDEKCWSDKLNNFGLKVVDTKAYLSKNNLSLWDVIAAFGFIFKRINCPAIIRNHLKGIEKSVFYLILSLFCIEKNLDKEMSAGLLVIAQKESVR